MTPPVLELSSELRWVLLRAFASPDLPCAHPGSAERAVELARTLDLAARIATRQPHGRLVSELSAGGARKLQMLRLRVLALNQVLSRTTSLVADCAQRLGIQLVLLKHSALCASGIVNPGARDARDVDVLVDGANAAALQRELCNLGFRAASGVRPRHHLPTLLRDAGEVVEIHDELWGLTLPGAGGPCLASQIVSAGLTTSCQHAEVPVPALLAAHALVHALIQHRTATHLYPTLRLLGDLCDLRFSGIDELAYRGFVSAQLSQSSLSAVRGLVSALELGADPDQLGQRGEVSDLLAHLIAGALDTDYQDALFLERRHVVSAVRDRLSSFFSLIRAPEPRLPAGSAAAEMRRIAARLGQSCLGYMRLKLRRKRPLRV